MTSIFDNADFLDKEKELNKKIQPWVEEAKKSYHAAEGFLGNKAIIQERAKKEEEDELKDEEKHGATKMYQLATRAPKGGHLHIHLNSCLEPDFLLNKATDKEVNQWMYISLPEQKGALTKKNYKNVTKVKFHFMTSLNHKDPGMSSVWIGNIFDQDYMKLNEKKKSGLKEDWFTGENAINDDKILKNQERIKVTNRLIQLTDYRIQQKKNLEEAAVVKKWLQQRSANLAGNKVKLAEKKAELAKKEDDFLRKNINLDERMLFMDFIRVFNEQRWGDDAITWLKKKLVFSADEVQYDTEIGTPETCKAQWEKFDIRTQMMAGLFNTEYAYRKYLREMLNSFQEDGDNIQYAEVRPNFMKKNQVFSASNPRELMNNFRIMDIIINEYEKHQERRRRSNKPLFGGLKVIYCTPRVFEKDEIKWALDECFEMKKKGSKYEKYIAGFDIIGPENKDNPLFFFKEELQAFQEKCKSKGVHCPFLFHAGESHTDPNRNLDVALELGAKRIAHCYAIKPKEKFELLQMCKTKVYLASEAKKREKKAQDPKMKALCKEAKKAQDLCIECCPISNEILGLHPHVKDAVVYKLMDEGIPCALASDNPTLFSSTLAHEFYQFMIGKPKFNLQDWRQLMRDSLEHAVWNDDKERNYVVGLWERSYRKFVNDELNKLNSNGSGNPQGINSEDVTDHGAHPPKPTGTLAVKSNQENHAAAPTPGPDTSKTFKKATLLQQVAHQTAPPPPHTTRPPTQRQGSLDNTRANTSTATTKAPNQRQLYLSAPTPAADMGRNPAQENVSATTATTAATTTTTMSRKPIGQVVNPTPKRVINSASTTATGQESTTSAPVHRRGSGSTATRTSRDPARRVIATTPKQDIDSASANKARQGESPTPTPAQRQSSVSTPTNMSGGATAKVSPPANNTPATRVRR